MLTVDEYIARRKSEDRLDEFNHNSRMDNLKSCINYLFEYFDYYLNSPETEERTVLENEKLNQYRKQLQEYSPGVREWLVTIYAEHGKHVNRTVGNILKSTDLFLLYSSDSEFRSISYDCHSQLLSKHPFLKGQTESLFLFIKEYHRIQSQRHREMYGEPPFISYEINEWIEETWTEYHVNLAGFCREWVHRFWENIESWPVTHRLRSKDPFYKYEYDYKQKSNLFNLDSLYRQMPKKPFIKGRKQEFEILMMYHWLHSIVGDDKGYWQEYVSKTLPATEAS